MSWVKKKVLIPLRNALKNGVSQKKLATSLALGITIGLIPFYGLTTILVGIIAYALRLDFILMQAVHYMVQPLQIILLIPFFKAGSLFSKNSHVDFTVQEYITLFKSDFWLALSELWKANLLAIIVWGLISIPLFYGLYKVFRYTIKRYSYSLVRRPVCKA